MPRGMMPRLRCDGLPSFCSATARTALAISVTSDAWAALSLFDETAFNNNYAGLKFDISGAQPDISLSLSVRFWFLLQVSWLTD